MLGLHERSRHSVDPKLTSSKAHDGPLLNFGRLNEVSSTSTPIQFGAVAVPTEVFYEIIDNLSSDKSTLAHLSRVCKSWYYGTRPHLFREVSIKETGTTYLWYPFARTLRTTPEVCGLVRELHISMDMHSIRHTMSVGGSDKNEYNLYVLANVVRKLQGLKVLTFTDAEWHVDDSSELVPVPRIYHLGLRTLVFRKGHFSRSLYEIVSWFPGLKTLCVEREHGGLAQVGQTQALCKGLQLETLELNSEPMTYDRLLQEIAQTESVNTVRSFTYHVWHASLLVLCEFLARAGPHLHTLRLAFKDERLLEEWKRHGFFGVPQIAECTALETLTLSLPLKSSRIWGNHVAAVSHCIEHLFAAIHTEKLHTIIFHLDITHAETQFENLQFETLRRFLHKLPYLQHIAIITRRSSVNRAYKDMVRSLAPFRRMLHVRASDGPDELPSRRTSSVLPGGQGDSETAPYHAHGGPLFLPMDTHTSDSDSAESEIQSE